MNLPTVHRRINYVPDSRIDPLCSGKLPNSGATYRKAIPRHHKLSERVLETVFTVFRPYGILKKMDLAYAPKK